jgi:hypothetical protein
MSSAFDEVLRAASLAACLLGLPLLFMTHCSRLRRLYLVYVVCYVVVTIAARWFATEPFFSLRT